MSITGKLSDELRAEGWATSAEALRRFEGRGLIESTLQSWCSKDVVESIKVGRFLWVKLADVEKRVVMLEANRPRTLGMNDARWGKTPTTDAPPTAAANQRLAVYTLEELKAMTKDAVREVLREFGLVS